MDAARPIVDQVGCDSDKEDGEERSQEHPLSPVFVRNAAGVVLSHRMMARVSCLAGTAAVGDDSTTGRLRAMANAAFVRCRQVRL